MAAFDTARAQRPVPCCRVAENCEPFALGGEPGAGVLARQAERCRICGRRHFGARLAAGQYGVRPADLTLGGQ